jgi:HNH endonuclease
MSQDRDFSIGDRFEGVLVETFRESGISRPRVRPLEYFPDWMRVEFPRDLREIHPINTRFRADVIVKQKHSGVIPHGPPYLVADRSSIVRETGYKPRPTIMAVIRPGTISGRTYDYYEIEEANESPTSIAELREQAYQFADMAPPKVRREGWERTRSQIIAQYALIRSRGICEGCKQSAPFMRRNGEPYLEIHHIHALGDGGSDHPLNVAAVCPNCHSRVTHGKDADAHNALIAQNVKAAEAKLESESK